MWPWQQKKSEKTDQQLLWRVLQISFLGHLIVLICFLLSGHSSVLHVSMRSFPANAKIVCVPSFMLPSCKNRYAGKRGASTGGSHNAVAQSSASGGHQSEKLTTVQTGPRKLSKRELRRERARLRKLEREKKFLDAKQAKQKLAAQQRVAQEKLEQEKLERDKRESEKKRAAHEPAQETAEQKSSQEVVAEETNELGDGGDETVIFVDSATYQMTEVMKELQEALQEVWEAPAGCAVGYSCEVMVTVSGSGTATAVTISKKSGAAIYDTAARAAASAAIYPKLVYNRTIVIHFGE